jgi:hypothetical protein
MTAMRAAVAMIAAVAAAVVALAPPAARADEALALAGVTTDDDSNRSYGWQIELRKRIWTQLGASVSWINEGHRPAHARDGAAVQAWWISPVWYGRLQLLAGAGPYLYFDTQPSTLGRGYSNLHGSGGVISAAVAVRVHGSWVLQLRANALLTAGNPNTFGLLAGAGYHFAVTPAGKTSGAGAAAGTASTLQLFGGEAIVNALSSRSFPVIGADYRAGLGHWAAWSASWFDDLAASPGLHHRAAAQLWLLDRVAGRSLTFGVGLGPYVRFGALGGGAAAPARVSGLSSLRVDWHCAPRVSLILTWYRNFTQDDRDRDILTAGIGWRFGAVP